LTEGGPTASIGTVDGVSVTPLAEVVEQKYRKKLKELGGE